jgi:carboxymethylenebutenolidase
VGIEKRIKDAENLGRPLMLHIPEKDRIVPPDAQAKIIQSLQGRAELFTYPNADHAFNRVGSHSYHAEATRISYARTADFLHRFLGS